MEKDKIVKILDNNNDILDRKLFDELCNFKITPTTFIEKKPLTIGFNLDDVVRGTSERIYWFYVKDYIRKHGVEPKLNYEDVDLSDLMGSLGFATNDSVIVTDNNYDEIVDNTNGNYKESLSEYQTFIQDNYLDIFGNTKEVYKGASVDLNNLFELLIENNIKPIIIQRESGIIRNATLLFLSDKGISVNQINFIRDYNEAFNLCDYFVTANPNFLTCKNTKNTIKLNKHYNIDIKSNYIIKDIKDMFELSMKLK